MTKFLRRLMPLARVSMALFVNLAIAWTPAYARLIGTNPTGASVDVVCNGGGIHNNTVTAYTEVCHDYQGSLIPTSILGGQNLGTAALPWQAIYVSTVVASGNQTITGNLTVAGNTTLGDNGADTFTINAGTTIIRNIVGAVYISTSVTSAVPIMSLDGANGRVGIGDSSPDAQLEVLSNSGATGFVLAVSSQNDTTGNILSILGTGFVGIGNASPTDGKLDIINTSAGVNAVAIAIQNNSATAGTSVSLDFGAFTSLPTARISALNESGSAANSLVFATHNGGTFTEKMRITGAGSLGIGTASPATLVHMSSGTLTIDGTAAKEQVIGGLITVSSSVTSGFNLTIDGAYTTTQIRLKTPTAVGQMIYNSTLNNICLSTGTAAVEQYKLVGTAATACE